MLGYFDIQNKITSQTEHENNREITADFESLVRKEKLKL